MIEYNNKEKVEVYDSDRFLNNFQLINILKSLVFNNNNLFLNVLFENIFELPSNFENRIGICENYNIFNFGNLFNDGLTDFFCGNYKNALNQFNTFLNNLPHHIEALYYKSLSQGGLDEFENAIDTIERAIKINPWDYRLWNEKGSFLSEMNFYVEALECFDKSIDLYSNAYNWSNKAVLYHKLGDLDNALECYECALFHNSEDIFSIIGEAKVFMQLGDIDNVEGCFQKAARIDSNDLEYLIENGKFMLYKKEYKQAIKLFDKCLRYDDCLEFVWMFKSIAFNELGCFNEADICVQKAMQLDPTILSRFNEMFGICD